MPSLLGWVFCFFGLHDWKDSNHGYSSRCTRCPKTITWDLI